MALLFVFSKGRTKMRKSRYLRYRYFLKLIELFFRIVLALLELIQRLV
jgi:hypothetical protein